MHGSKAVKVTSLGTGVVAIGPSAHPTPVPLPGLDGRANVYVKPSEIPAIRECESVAVPAFIVPHLMSLGSPSAKTACFPKHEPNRDYLALRQHLCSRL